MSDIQNLIMNGTGNSSGGLYNKVKVRGDATISDNLECNIFKTLGTVDILGNVKADKFDVYGEAEIRGNIHSEEIKIFGTLAIGGSAHIEKAKIWGTLTVEDKMKGETADVKGSVIVNGDLEAENFFSNGLFEIKGMLNADRTEIGLRFGSSKANEIVGEKITVKRKSMLIPFQKSNGCLHAQIIEGNEIYLEYTEADLVRGHSVHIGPGCEIRKVEYHSDFSCSSDSSVKEHHKI